MHGQVDGRSAAAAMQSAIRHFGWASSHTPIAGAAAVRRPRRRGRFCERPPQAVTQSIPGRQCDSKGKRGAAYHLRLEAIYPAPSPRSRRSAPVERRLLACRRRWDRQAVLGLRPEVARGTSREQKFAGRVGGWAGPRGSPGQVSGRFPQPPGRAAAKGIATF